MLEAVMAQKGFTAGGWTVGDMVGYQPAAEAPETAGAHGWYIAYVGGMTAPAVTALKRRGWDSFVPMALVDKPKAKVRGVSGRSKAKRGRLRADRTKGVLRRISVPIYPGYVFVAANSEEPEAWDVAHVPGIAYLVHRADGDVVRLPNGVIEEVRARAERSQELREAAEKVMIYEVGTHVRICDGPFASFDGLVEECTTDRVKVGVAIFGRTAPVELDLDQIEIVG
jgi:transcription antitermination factor NusG